MLAYLSQYGPNLAPSWLQMAQVGPRLGPSWLQLGSSWTHVGPRSGSPATPEPTQALPNPFPVASGPPKPPFVPYKTQHRPQKGSQTSNLDLHNPQLDPKRPQHGSKRHLPGFQILLPRPGGMGRSLFEYIYIYIQREREILSLFCTIGFGPSLGQVDPILGGSGRFRI